MRKAIGANCWLLIVSFFSSVGARPLIDNTTSYTSLGAQYNIRAQIEDALNDRWRALSTSKKSISYLKRITPFLSWINLCNAVQTDDWAFLLGSCLESEHSKLLWLRDEQYRSEYSAAIQRLWAQNELDAITFSSAMFGLSTADNFIFNALSIIQIIGVPTVIILLVGRFGLRKTFFASAAISLFVNISTQIAITGGSDDIHTLLNVYEIYGGGFGVLAAVSGAILFARWIRAKRSTLSSLLPLKKLVRTQSEGGLSQTNAAKWAALVRFDPDIAAAVTTLRPYGDKWVNEIGRGYFALNEDRQYLPHMVNRLQQEAEQEQVSSWAERFRETYDGERCTEKSLNILREAERRGFQLSVDGKSISATKDGATNFLRSNSDILRLGEHWPQSPSHKNF